MWRKTVTSLLAPGNLLVKWLGYRLYDQGSGLDSWQEFRFVSSPQHPDWPWWMKPTTHLHLVPRLRMHGAISSLFNVFMASCLIKLGDNCTFFYLAFTEFWWIISGFELLHAKLQQFRTWLFWGTWKDITHTIQHNQSGPCHLLSYWFLAWLILRPRRWSRHVPPNCRFTFSRLHGVLAQEIELFKVYESLE
jgi:hypothetical protein